MYEVRQYYGDGDLEFSFDVKNREAAEYVAVCMYRENPNKTVQIFGPNKYARFLRQIPWDYSHFYTECPLWEALQNIEGE